MAVIQGEKRLNPRGESLSERVRGKVRYGLYAGDPGIFLAKQNFRVTVGFSDGGRGVTFARVPAASAAPAAALYRGIDHDVVGPGSRYSPDGRKDGHFTLTLDTQGRRRVVRTFLLQTSDPTGEPKRGQVWDTVPGGNWILGVYRGGKRLNPRDGEISDAIRGKVQYELYANKTGWFKPGQDFVISVRFQDGGETLALARVPEAPKAALAAMYRGIFYDVVGEGRQGQPDGRKDPQFSLTLSTLGKDRVVTALSLYTADDIGGADNRQIWDTRANEINRTLGVYRANRRLSPANQALSDKVRGVILYEIYASATKHFLPKATFLVKVHFADGGETAAITRIAADPKARVEALYRGMRYDVVGRGTRITPDGRKDGQISIRVNTLGKRRVVEDILVQTADSLGDFDNRQGWSARPGENWILGVYRGRKRLNPPGRKISNAANGIVQYEVYAAAAGFFKPGQTFRITIRFADEGTAVGLFRVPGKSKKK
ncbi:MAG: hypothetical protein QGF68_10320 [Nitrospinota bacterium]|nr:hypothetical protein [Nitrospinota bacterium]HJM41748.1 hypothetical protein [Nitrospinota bacterium]